MATTRTELINSSLSSLASGVTQQYQEGRFDSQVDEMDNCIPSITRGVMRRNPLFNIGKLADLKVMDLTLATPAYRDLTTAEIANSFVYSYDRGTGTEQYIVIIPGNGDIHTYNIDGTKISHIENKAYLSLAEAGTTAAKSFKAMTIGDLTFIVNKTIKVGFDTTVTAAGTSEYNNMAFYWIKKTVSIVVEQYQSTSGASGDNPLTTSGSLMKGYTYTLNNLSVEAGEETRIKTGITPYALNTSKLLAAHMVTATNSPHSEATKVKDSIAYNDNFTGNDWTWSDSFGDGASLGVWKNISDSKKLPTNLPLDLGSFVVKVSGGTSAEFDDYYLQYNYDNKTWKEIPAPGSYTTLDDSTMPHVLYALSDVTGTQRVFAFDTYQGTNEEGTALDSISKWGERTSGGDDTLEDPSFVGNSINNILFHKNRLGFLTDDNIILSRTGDYGNFFIQTLQEVLDDDPIDLAVASKDVTILRHAVSTAGQLILFSDDSQFSLSSLDGALTPNTADIVAISNYAYGSSADAVAVGNRVFFAHKAGGSSQLFSYKVNDQGSQITEATPMTIHLPTYIKNSVTKIVGHDVLGYTFLETEGVLNELTVLSSITRGSEELQNAFHRWVFSENIASTQMINSALYILFTTGDLGRISLEVPSDISTVNYVDGYSTGSVNYTSNIKFSEFFIRDGNGKGTVRGRYQLRTLKHTITENSKYLTTVGNSDLSTIDLSIMFGPTWDDTAVWDDTLGWIDNSPIYTREYENDDLITVMTDSKKAQITFSNSKIEPTKGFEIATTNIEGFFHQRSLRR